MNLQINSLSFQVFLNTKCESTLELVHQKRNFGIKLGAKLAMSFPLKRVEKWDFVKIENLAKNISYICDRLPENLVSKNEGRFIPSEE